MSWTAAIPTVLDWSFRILGLTTHVRVRTHMAQFVAAPGGTGGEVALFINVTNVSLSQEAELTHVWVEGQTAQVPPDHLDRPLPVRLRPKQTWETWITLNALSAAGIADPGNAARARLSDGRVIKGKPDKNVPHFGHVPGGSSADKPRP
jgi:hypothetical protein